MYKILVGMILALFDIVISIDHMRIDIVPDFVGYILIWRELVELEDEATYFVAAEKNAYFMKIFMLAFFVLDLFGIKSAIFKMGLFGSLTTIVYLLVEAFIVVMFLYIAYDITCGVQEMEEEYEEDMCGDELMRAWKVMAIASAIYMLCYIISFYLSEIGLITSVLVIVAQTYYLVRFCACARRY